jgi:ABC-type transport system involved in multi-copper enzyme maturation permease subunit
MGTFMRISPVLAVIVRRLQLQLRSATWWGASILMAVVFSAAAYRSVRLFDIDSASFEADQSRHSDEASRFPQTYSQVTVSVDRAPAPLRLLLRGSEDTFAACVTTYGRFHVTSFRGRDTESRYGKTAFVFDPATVLGILGSLLAIVLGSSTVAREREEGTLQLTLTYPCRRSAILFGEHVATLITVAIPILTCTLLLIAYAAMSQRLVLDRSLLLELCSFIALCLLVSSTFSGLGLLVATVVRRPATAVSVAFAVWAILVFAYPMVLPTVVALVQPAEPSASSLLTADTLAEYDLTPVADAGAGAIDDRNLRVRLAQARVRDSLAAASPYSLFILGVEDTFGSGADASRAFLEQVRAVESVFRRWQDAVLTRYPDRANTYNPTDPPLDLDGLPSNQVERSGSSSKVAIVVLLLLTWNLAFTIATQVRFRTYDARA